MGVENIQLWTCNLCRKVKPEVEARKSGWIKYDVDHPMVDREWITRVICGPCREDIQRCENRTA